MSLYWFAARHQTSLFRRQTRAFLYSKFTVKLNELSPGLSNQPHLEKGRYTHFAVRGIMW